MSKKIDLPNEPNQPEPVQQPIDGDADTAPMATPEQQERIKALYRQGFQCLLVEDQFVIHKGATPLQVTGATELEAWSNLIALRDKR